MNRNTKEQPRIHSINCPMTGKPKSTPRDIWCRSCSVTKPRPAPTCKLPKAVPPPVHKPKPMSPARAKAGTAKKKTTAKKPAAAVTTKKDVAE